MPDCLQRRDTSLRLLSLPHGPISLLSWRNLILVWTNGIDNGHGAVGGQSFTRNDTDQ